MARLQDFQSVTPSASDNLLVVQATGQGLAPFGSTIGNKALKSDLAAISITGTTNNTGSTISAGTFFYLNGTLVRAKQDIQNNATFTTTNKETVTAGGLNKLNDDVKKSVPEYWSLFTDASTSNTTKQISVATGRKISDFTILFAVVVRGGGERVSSFIPVGRFTTGIWVSLTEVDSANTQRWYEVKYVDDTHITVQCSSNAEGSDVRVFGLGTKLTY
jgi:hypothetical protein